MRRPLPEPGRCQPAHPDGHPDHHDASDQDSPQWTDQPPPWDHWVDEMLPSDDSGYRITPDDCEFLGVDPQEVANWFTREAPLGMTPEQFAGLRDGLFDGLRQDGVAPTQADVRLQGSSANFLLRAHKSLPSADEITNPAALQRYEEWRGDATEHPLRRPFDSMYRLDLDDEPSDYDIQVSSDAMLAHAQAVRDQMFPNLELVHPKYGFINKTVAQAAFPHLYEWAIQESQRLGRSVVPAVFPGSGPPDHSTMSRASSHFRDNDWRIKPEGER